MRYDILHGFNREHFTCTPVLFQYTLLKVWDRHGNCVDSDRSKKSPMISKPMQMIATIFETYVQRMGQNCAKIDGLEQCQSQHYSKYGSLL